LCVKEKDLATYRFLGYSVAQGIVPARSCLAVVGVLRRGGGAKSNILQGKGVMGSLDLDYVSYFRN